MLTLQSTEEMQEQAWMAADRSDAPFQQWTGTQRCQACRQVRLPSRSHLDLTHEQTKEEMTRILPVAMYYMCCLQLHACLDTLQNIAQTYSGHMHDSPQ